MNNFNIYHNSRDEVYRYPFGAVKCGDKVTLKIKIEGIIADEVLLRCWGRDDESNKDREIIFCMEKCTSGEYYEKTIQMPETPSLFWYYFIIKKDGQEFYYSNNKRRGGAGELTEYKTDNSYQITVYDKNFKTPEWFYDAVMYQIFPDRFYSSGRKKEKKYNEYFIHSDWYEPLSNIMHPYENGPAACDFFGGDLKGIEEKLPYLSKLGISVIYLNPIFEAYSNHRYDTGDYKKIDPMLGTEQDFEDLCKKAEEFGIKIILDGVFSHTGSDSVYFNKYGNYGDGGAYTKKDSLYREWYDMSDDGSYRSWWGCSNLPNICEMTPSYLDYILRDKDSVIKKWLRLGASGWRLDVADELPDEFIKILRKEAKSEKEDAVIIGEVWEDASNKVSYSSQREYLLGDELDSVMNYPFKDLFIGFILNKTDGKTFEEGIMSIIENYPPCVLYSLMNLVSTHDTMRIKTVLGEPNIPDNLTFEQKQSFKLSCFEETMAIKRQKLIAFLQMTFVGVPCIYYGDEIGMQGIYDPFNRMPYTWRSVDPELLSFYKELIAIRNQNEVLRVGGFKIICAEGDILVYEREIRGGKDALGRKKKNKKIICILNRGNEEKNVFIENSLSGGEYESLFTGREYGDKKTLFVTVSPYSADILSKKE